MLTIKVNGNALHIAKGTSLQLEVNSSVFSTDSLEGDILFTFDVPASLNDTVFRHARFVYVQRMKKYACTVLAGGIEIARGDLYIQKATSTVYSCGLVVNPWPIDFPDRKLCDNDYGEDIVISRNANTHNAKWVEFLKSTLEAESVIKFPLFLDMDFYGSGNSDFGWFLLQSDSAPSNVSGIQASLQTNNNIGLDRCYINRLFFDDNGEVIEEISGNRGIRLFNNRRADNPNSFAFCPALRLPWLLERVVENGGYRAMGGFFEDEDIRKVFSQSLRSLDGLLTQYTEGEAGLFVDISPAVSYSAELPANSSRIVHFYDSEYNQQYTFTPNSSANHSFSMVIKTYLPANILGSGSISEYYAPWNTTIQRQYVEALLLMVTDARNSLCEFETSNLNGNWSSITPLSSSFIPTEKHVFIKPGDLSSFGYAGAGFYEIPISFSYSPQTTEYKFIFVKCRGIVEPGQGTGGQVRITNYENVPITDDVSAYYKVFNCFSNRMRYGDHVPGMTNADFISTLCNTFGLAIFLDSSSKTAEFAFIRDILDKSRFLDLTEYAIDKETALEKQDERKYVFKLEGISPDDTDETKLLPAVRTCDALPDALANYGQSCFVENENQYRKSEREGNAVSNWVFKWNPQGGANQTIEVGEGSEENITPSVKIPTMKVTDERSSNPEFVMQIKAAGCSPIFDTGNKDFDMVLEYYFGSRSLNCPAANNPFFELAQPTIYKRNGDELDGVSLTVNGENSVGERWVKPWLELLAGYERVKYRFSLPLSEFLRLWQLLKPQDLSAERQTRWLMVGNVKSLPIQITFQFTEGANYVIAEVEAAKVKVEL